MNKVWDEVDFSHADKHQSFKIDATIFGGFNSTWSDS